MATAPISDTDTRDDYTATAGQTSFAYTFWIKDDDDLDVYQNGTLLTKTTHYTVSATQSVSGGNVVLVSGATEGDEIAIVYNPAIERQTEFQTSGSFRASSLNLELTYIISLLQFLRTKLERVAKLEDDVAFTGDFTFADPDTHAGELVIVNDDENGFEYASISDLSSTVDTVLTSIASGDILQWDGANWVNKDLGEIVDGHTAATIAVGDKILFADISDSNAPKEGTVQAVIDLVANDLQGKADTVIAATDKLTFYDVSDSNLPKTDTVQGILDLVPTPVVRQLRLETFTASGTFTTSANISADTKFKFTVTGGGGGGGGMSQAAGNAAGGGAGGTAIYWVSGLAANTGYTVTIGAAGSAGASSGTSGGAGGNSTVVIGATTITGAGGSGGEGDTATGAKIGGSGGSATNGTINISGGSGGSSIYTGTVANHAGGVGGASYWGGGGKGGTGAASAGQAGQAYGAGGGGASGTAAGGAGKAGVVTVEWVE